MHIVPLLLQTLGQDQKVKNTHYFFSFFNLIFLFKNRDSMVMKDQQFFMYDQQKTAKKRTFLDGGIFYAKKYANL